MNVESEEELSWIKSSYSSDNCVELAGIEERILVRNSKNCGVAPIAFTVGEWDAFLKGAKAGEFDHLASLAPDREDAAE